MRSAVVPSRLLVGSQMLTFDHVVDPDYDDPIAQEVLRGEFVMSGSLIWLLSCIKQGDSILDLGAHIGTFALPAARLGARVVAVDGSPHNIALLRLACHQNQVSQIQCERVVVDGTPHEVEFVVLGPFGTIATPEVCSAVGYPSIPTSAITLDDVPGGPFRWVKIDVEGVEESILRGGERTIRHIAGMVIESNGHMLGLHRSSPESLIRRLRRMGLSVYEVGINSLRPIPRPFMQPETIVDYVATHGPPPLPKGWSLTAPRAQAELLELLGQELRHPNVHHRDHARRCVENLPPLWAHKFRRMVTNQP